MTLSNLRGAYLMAYALLFLDKNKLKVRLAINNLLLIVEWTLPIYLIESHHNQQT